MSSTSFVSQHVLQGLQVIWDTNTIIWWSSSWGHTIEGSFRRLGTNDTWTWYKSSSNHIFDNTMSKSSLRWSKWTLEWPNSESGRKSYAFGKITDTALSGRPAWLRPTGIAPPQNTYRSSSQPWGLTNGPPNTWRQAKSESKTERPHMPLQWAPEMAVWCWDDHPSLDLHMHARKHKENQCQPLDGS